MLSKIIASNKDLDTTIMVVGYIFLLCMHMIFVYKSDTYATSESANRLSELFNAWGIAMLGVLFGKSIGLQQARRRNAPT